MSKEAIEILEKILKPLDDCEPQCKLNLNPEKIRKAIALLKAEQPPVGEMAKRFDRLTEELKSMFTVSQAMAKNSFDSTPQPIKNEPYNPDPPPDHKYPSPEQPPASEFTKECRAHCEVYLRGGWTTQKQIKTIIKNVGLLGIEVRLGEARLAVKKGFDLCGRLDASEASRKELAAAFKRYGHHDRGCANILDLNDDAECTCGFEVALDKAKETNIQTKEK